MGHNHQLFEKMIKFGQDEYELITHNYPALDKSQDTLEFLAKYFANEISKHMTKNDTYALLGVSLGASLCLRINEILGNNAENLFLLATGGTRVARIRKEMITAAIDNQSEIDFLKQVLSLDNEVNFLSHFCENKSNASEYFHKLQKIWHESQDEAVSDFIELSLAAIEIDYETQLSRYQSKIIILWGDKDKVFSKRNLSKIVECAPEATVIRFKEYGHYLPLEAPQEVLKVVRNYV